MWGSQDHVNGKKATGIITLCDRERTKLAKVYWAGGTKQVYRIGAHGAFDLSIKGKNKNSISLFIFRRNLQDHSITSMMCIPL